MDTRELKLLIDKIIGENENGKWKNMEQRLITKITIKSRSGYGSAIYAYKDKLTIEEGSIAYEYKPLLPSEENQIRKWSYRTGSPLFKSLYDKITGLTMESINREPDCMITDAGGYLFDIKFDDGTKIHKRLDVYNDWFTDLFTAIEDLIPATELLPEMMKDDPTCIDELFAELETYEDGYEISTGELYEKVFGDNDADLMNIHEVLMEFAGDHGFELDMSKHIGLMEGLPYNLEFTVRRK